MRGSTVLFYFRLSVILFLNSVYQAMNTPLETVPCSPQWQRLSDSELLELYPPAGPDEVQVGQLFNVLYSRHVTPPWKHFSYKEPSPEDAADFFVAPCFKIISLACLAELSDLYLQIPSPRYLRLSPF